MNDFELDAILRRELLTGERLLWSGRPDPRKMRSVFAIWGFAVPWTAFALFWEMMALSVWFKGAAMPDGMRIGFGLVFPLFGLPFIAIGGWLMAMPLRARRLAAVSIFGLTDRRLLRVTAAAQRDVKSVMIDQMGPIAVKANADGTGTLRIDTGSHRDSDGDKVIERFEVPVVPQVARLEQLLLEARSRVQG